MRKKVLVCSINYNTSDKTIAMIESANIHKSKNIFDLFIIDNSEEHSELLKMENYCRDNDIHYTKSSDNIGYALAMNPFFDYAATNEYYAIVFMNNDLILHNNALDYIVDFSIKYPDGIYCSLQKSNDIDRIVTCTGTINTDTIIGGYMAPYVPGEYIAVDFVISAVMLIPTSLYIKYKIKFNEFYFLYVEENDLCYRYKKMGIKSYVVNDSICYHDNGGSSGGIKNPNIWYYRMRNTLRYDRHVRAIGMLRLWIKLFYLFLVTLKNHKLHYIFLSRFFSACNDYDNLSIIKKSFK